MRKIQLLGLALGAVCVFSALTTSSAFALPWALANWLENGNIVTVTKAVVTEGNLLFENTVQKGGFLCSWLFDGNIGPNGADDVTKILSNGGTAIAELHEEGATSGFICTTDEKICETGTEVWPVNLPFLTQLMLDTENGLFYDLVQLNAAGLGPAYQLLCLVFPGVSVNQLCEVVNDETFGELSNATNDVEWLGALTPLASCNGETENWLIERNALNVALIRLSGGTPPLQVSE